MASIAFRPPKSRLRLLRSCRPSSEEIETYAALIAAREGVSRAYVDAFREQAELQLWAWHSEHRVARHRRGRAA